MKKISQQQQLLLPVSCLLVKEQDMRGLVSQPNRPQTGVSLRLEQSTGTLNAISNYFASARVVSGATSNINSAGKWKF